mmetsp:Transcript_30073/g.61936  ORF Transcript_30073/g.61936 Transcript_30073/m.61936 type:complete len:319 (+) Transcript_30073:1059-2015(+)
MLLYPSFLLWEQEGGEIVSVCEMPSSLVHHHPLLLHVLQVSKRPVDGVPNELLQLLPSSLLLLLLQVVNDALTKGHSPPHWKDTVYMLLTKKAPAELLTNQRPMALCNTTYKLYNMVINSRLTCMAEENSLLETEQEGGRRNRSTVRQLQRLRWNLDDAKRRGKQLYVLFIDTTNAFCSINHKVMWSILRAYGIPELDVQHLEQQLMADLHLNHRLFPTCGMHRFLRLASLNQSVDPNSSCKANNSYNSSREESTLRPGESSDHCLRRQQCVSVVFGHARTFVVCLEALGVRKWYNVLIWWSKCDTQGDTRIPFCFVP